MKLNIFFLREKNRSSDDEPIAEETREEAPRNAKSKKSGGVSSLMFRIFCFYLIEYSNFVKLNDVIYY